MSDLPVWQALRTELHPRGLGIVTVGMDTAGPEACRPFIEAARPDHPSLVDVGHVMAELGVVDIPNGVWIDEAGMIVRPAEPASHRARCVVRGVPERMKAIFAEADKIHVDREAYGRALRDWVEFGSASRFVLSPADVIARSGRRDHSAAEGAAHFGLGQHLWRAGRSEVVAAVFAVFNPDEIVPIVRRGKNLANVSTMWAARIDGAAAQLRPP